MEEPKKTPLKDVEFLIEDESEDFFGDISLISIVKTPAILKSFQLFSDINSNNEFKFSIENNDKQIITGPVMIPDKRILRQNKKTKEYFNGFFSEETIKKCSEIFLKNSNHLKSSLEHGEIKDEIKDCYITESWIVSNPNNDKANELGFTELVKGSWFCSMKITSPSLWMAIKENGFTGFSLEGNFAQQFSSLFTTEQNMQEKQIKNILFSSQINDSDKEKMIKKILFS